MTSFPCSWKDGSDCNYEARSNYNLYRHMLNEHWPWQLNRYVCLYCERGWHEKPAFDTHINSEKHGLLRQMTIMQSAQPACAKEFATNWLNRSLQLGWITREHYNRCLSYEKMTSEDVKEPLRIPGYDPGYPGMNAPAAVTPVRDERTKTPNSLFAIPSQAGHSIPTRLPPNSKTLTQPAMTANQSALQHLFSPGLQMPPLTSPLAKSPPSQNSELNSLMQPTAPHTISKPPAGLLATAAVNSHQPLTVETTQSTLLVQDISPAGARTPLPKVPPKRLATDTMCRPQHQIYQSRHNTTFPTPSQSPNSLSPLAPTDLPIPKRSRVDFVKAVTDADLRTQNILIATTMEKMTVQMEKMESCMKNKMKEISEAQTQDLNSRVQVAVKNAIAEEAFQSKIYIKMLISALQDNLIKFPRK